MIRVPEFDEDRYLVMVTRNGVIKRTPLDVYKRQRLRGVYLHYDLFAGHPYQAGCQTEYGWQGDLYLSLIHI